MTIKITDNFLMIKNQNNDICEFHEATNIKEFDTFSELEVFTKNCNNNNILIAIPFAGIFEKYPDIQPKFTSKIIAAKITNTVEFKISDLEEYKYQSFEILDLNHQKSEKEMLETISNVINQEINNGSGSNFTIANQATGSIKNFSTNHAISLFYRLCKQETNAYQIFLLKINDQFIIGASPECHLNIKNQDVTMQPISGTYRKTSKNIQTHKSDLLEFLRNQKEIDELFMTVDEELKMMAKICPSGGMVIGPRLREMSKVIHTEYLLTGKTNLEILDCIKESMHAATVVGSPIKKAAEISEIYNNFDRSFYGGIIGIIKDCDNFDSSIVIRSIEINKNGKFKAQAGASIVKDSNPADEVAEINAKLSSILSLINDYNENKPETISDYLFMDNEISIELNKRNQNLSKFLMFKNSTSSNQMQKIKKSAIIINNEDDFTNMFIHILVHLGIESKVIHYSKFDATKIKDQIAILGPGPGNPNSIMDNKININDQIAKTLLNTDSKIKFAGICLGHQIIAKNLGFEVNKSAIGTQGEQVEIDYFGQKEICGFYNTFYAKYQPKINHELEISYNHKNLDIYGIRGQKFFTMQFHPESILTTNGLDIIKSELDILYSK
jgi:phenazine biosynthesis protein phzE